LQEILHFTTIPLYQPIKEFHMAVAKKKVVASKPAVKAPIAKVAPKAVTKVASKVAPKAIVAKPVAKPVAKVVAKAAPVAVAKPATKAPVAKVAAKPVAKAASKVIAPVAKAPEKAAVLKDVVFSVYSPESKSVEIAGDFNNWDPTKSKMKKDKDGNWLLKLKLGMGVYQYKIVYDSTSWEPDQKAPSIQVEHGQNSILNVE
jgi:hypothetical protein